MFFKFINFFPRIDNICSFWFFGEPKYPSNNQ